MQITIENFLNNIKDSDKKKRFLKICFNTDVKAKQKNRFPYSFLILEHNFSQREVLFASKIYLDDYASIEEKNKYYQVLDIYLNSLSEHSNKLYLIYKKTFYTFLQYSLSDEKFYNLTKEFMCDIEELLEYPKRYDALYANSNEREQYKKIKETTPEENIKNKFYYDICCKVEWNYEKIYLLSLKFGKPIPYILNMANLYATNILHQEQLPEISKLTREYYSKIKSSNPIKTIFEKLEKLENNQEIIVYLINNEIRLTTLKEYLNDYLNLYKKDLNVVDLRNLRHNLSEKIKLYEEYLTMLDQKNIKTEPKKIDLKNSEILIIEFINGNYSTKEEFCSLKEIKIEEFDEIIFNISKSNEELYRKYLDYIQKLNNQKEINNLEKISKMIYLIKYGVLENDKLRYFDILDYFTMTNLSFSKVLELCKKNFKPEDYNYLLAFINKNRTLNLITDTNIERILSEKNIVGVEFDSNNMPIIGTGYEVSREEKIEVLEELKSQNFPLFYQLYKLTLNRKFNIIHEKTK